MQDGKGKVWVAIEVDSSIIRGMVPLSMYGVNIVHPEPRRKVERTLEDNGSKIWGRIWDKAESLKANAARGNHQYSWYIYVWNGPGKITTFTMGSNFITSDTPNLLFISSVDTAIMSGRDTPEATNEERDLRFLEHLEPTSIGSQPRRIRKTKKNQD